MKAKIVFAEYNKNRYTLIHLGVKDGRVHALRSDLIPETSAKMIAVKSSILSIDRLKGWIKSEIPSIYKSAYRTFDAKAFRVLKEYEIPS